MAEISMGGIGEAFSPGTDGYNTNFVKLFYDDEANAFVLRNTVTGALVATIGQVQTPVVVAAVAGADFATAPYIAYPIGTTIMITNYAASGVGCTVIKLSLAGGDSTDWFILATDDKTHTGAISENPALP